MTDRSPRTGTIPLPSRPIITMERGDHSIGADGLSGLGSASAASGASPFNAANEMVAFPFVLWKPTEIFKGFVYNGSSAGGNFSLAIYDADFNVCAQTASTGGTGASAPQTVSLPAKLAAGSYYVAMAADNNTTNRYFRWTIATVGAGLWKMCGCWRQASITVGSLPSTATPVAYTNVAFPLFGLITRSNFDL